MHAFALSLVLIGWIQSDHFPPWTSFHSEVPAFLASCLGLYACWHTWRSKPQASLREAGAGDLIVPPALLLPAGLLCLAVIQWWAGLVPYGGDVLVTAIYLFVFAAAWFWGYQWAGTGKRDLLIAMCTLLCAGGVVTALQVLAQWLQVEADLGGWIMDGRMDTRPAGNMGQPNQSGTLLIMASVASAILHRHGYFRTPFLVLLLVLLGWTTVLTQSRTALLSVTMIVALHWWWVAEHPARWLERLKLSFWLIALLVAAWALQQLSWTASKVGIGAESMVAASGRPLLWQQLAAGLMESPWWGYGWLQVSTAQQAGAMSIPGIEQTNYAHNALLDLLIVSGVPLGLLILATVVWWLALRLKAIRAMPEASMAMLLLVPFLVHSMLELPHAYSFFLLIAGVLLGAVDRWTQRELARGWKLNGHLILVSAVLWGVFLSYTAYEYLLAEEDYRVNRFENRRLGETPADYQPPDLVVLTQLEEILRAMRLRAQPSMDSEDLDLLARVSRRYTWAPLLYRTALAQALNDRPTEAERTLRVIKSMFKPEIYEEARATWVRMGQEQYPVLRRVQLP
jgi:O-antigen ligase